MTNFLLVVRKTLKFVVVNWRSNNLDHYNSPAHKGEWEWKCVVNNKAKKTLNAKYDEKLSAFNHNWDWFNIEWPAKQKINWLRDACSRSISVYLANKNGAVSSSTWPLKVIKKLKGRCGFVGTQWNDGNHNCLPSSPKNSKMKAKLAEPCTENATIFSSLFVFWDWPKTLRLVKWGLLVITWNI